MRSGKMTFGLGLLAVAGFAQADAFGDLVQKTYRDQQIPGVVVGVVKNGKVVRVERHGVASLTWGQAVTADTKFELASLSKQFTAVLALTLVDEGKLALDDQLSKFFPKAPEKWGKVTVKQLMNHSSGLPEFAVIPPRYSSLTFFPYKRAQQLDDVWAMSPAFPAGTKFLYSNVGYQMLGHVIEAASGKTYPDLFAERISGPLGMKDTGFIDRTVVIPKLAEQYTLRDKRVAKWSIAETMGAFDFNAFGGLYSTINDLAKWELAMTSQKILKPGTWQIALTPFRTNDGKLPNEAVPYAAGWTVAQTDRGRLAVHSGHTGTAIVRNVDRGESVITLANLGSGNPKPFGTDRGFPVTEFTLDLYRLLK